MTNKIKVKNTLYTYVNGESHIKQRNNIRTEILVVAHIIEMSPCCTTEITVVIFAALGV